MSPKMLLALVLLGFVGAAFGANVGRWTMLAGGLPAVIGLIGAWTTLR